MATIAKLAQGTLFKIGDAASPEVFTTIPECYNLDVPDVRTELLDVTSHDSTGGFREYIAGLKDGEQVTAEINWVPTNTVHIGVRVDAYAATRRNFTQTFPVAVAAGDDVAFTGIIQQFKPTARAAEPLRATLAVKVTGMPVWGS